MFPTHKWAQEIIECAILLTSLLTKAYSSPLRSRAGPLGAAPSFGAPASRKVWGRLCQSSSRLGHNSGTPRSLRIKQGPQRHHSPPHMRPFIRSALRVRLPLSTAPEPRLRSYVHLKNHHPTSSFIYRHIHTMSFDRRKLTPSREPFLTVQGLAFANVC